MVRFLKTYTGILILINVIVFILSLVFSGIYGEKFFSLFALSPALVFSGKEVWTAFTSIFLHANTFHLLANMISLFFVGLFVERIIGKKRFLVFYLVAGIFASLFYALLSVLLGGSVLGARIFGDPNGFALGASGAIFGLVGLLAVLTPRNRIYLIAGPLIALIISAVIDTAVPSIASIVDIIVLIYFIFALFAMFSPNPSTRRFALALEMPFWFLPVAAIVPLIIIGLFIELPIGNTAHLGGLIAGLVYGFYLRKKYPKKTQMISRYFSRR